MVFARGGWRRRWFTRSVLVAIATLWWAALAPAAAADPGPARGAAAADPAARAAADWTIGRAQTCITPREALWLGGFAARTRPAEGTLDDLWVQALVMRAADGGAAVLIAADLVGVPKWLYDDVCGELGRRYGLTRRQIRLAPSHTHSGPVLRAALRDLYPFDARQEALIAAYSVEVRAAILATVERAWRERVAVSWWAGNGTAGFACNRRTNQESRLEELRRRGEPLRGPSDPTVPVLAARTPDGRWAAIVCGFAAHTSTLTQNYRWSADYAGVARRELEQRFPGARAYFFQGCGSDQSAVPRGSEERCAQRGAELAAAVTAVLAQPMRPVASRLRTGFEFVALDFGAQPTAAELAALAAGRDYRARWARRLAAEAAAGRTFASGYAEYPVQVWQLGADQLWIALGGEVCVDYALRCQREFGPTAWVNGYANDVMAYIPSRRVWEEGGYQAGAFEVYGLPATRWCGDIEERITGAVARLVAQVRGEPGASSRR